MKELNELIEKSKMANKMLNHIGCINLGCDKNGVIQVTEDEWEPCQWCSEKKYVQSMLNDLEQLRDKVEQKHTKEEIIEAYEQRLRDNLSSDPSKAFRSGIQYYKQIHGKK